MDTERGGGGGGREGFFFFSVGGLLFHGLLNWERGRGTKTKPTLVGMHQCVRFVRPSLACPWAKCWPRSHARTCLKARIHREYTGMLEDQREDLFCSC